METQTTLTGKPANKDVGKSASKSKTNRRYESFKEAFRSLRGESRPEILPFRSNSTEDNQLLKGTSEEANTINSTYSRNQSDGQYVIKQQPQAFRVRSTEGVSSTLQGEAGGTGAKTGLYAMPLKFLDRNQKNLQGEYSFTVDSVNTGGISKDMRIRRLTPLECQRLQSFPDNFYDNIEMSDSQKYKQMGNAVTTNVITAIVTQLVDSLNKS